jgi:DNA-directed RNA polymerase subunit RPC12/RpoP
MNLSSSASANDLLLNGILSAKEGDTERARFYLEWVLRETSTFDQRSKALYYLSKITQDPKEKIKWVEELLILDPGHPEGRRELAILRGQLASADIVQPDGPLPAPSTAPIAQRKTNCDTCGGKLVFSPDGRALDCERCGIRYPILPDQKTIPQSNDFVVALSQAKGHVAPQPLRSFVCSSCGATFAQSEARLSLTCPYCNTAFVPETNARDWIPPNTILPFRLDADAILPIIRGALATGASAEEMMLRGMFLPVWDFDISGSLTITANDGSGSAFSRWPVVYNHVLVPATHSLPVEALPTEYGIELSSAIPYQPEQLTDRPAEMYTITPADASLIARERILQKEAASVRIPSEGFLNSAELIVNTCCLALLPFWIVHSGSAKIFFHGWTGALAGEQPNHDS